jgi:hypothetical protein
VSDHSHYGEYADDRHDHDLDYAEKHHRHYDDERVVDELRRELQELREEMHRRLRQLEEQTPEARQAEYEADVAMADSEAWRSTLADYQVASGCAEYADEELSPVVCMRTIGVDGRLEQCGEPVDHEPTAECPGNPHARPAPEAGQP